MVKVQAIMEGVATRKDGGCGVRFSTQELNHADKVVLMESVNKFGWLLFAEDDVQPSDIPDIEGIKGKTPSQRLRAVLWLLADKEGVPIEKRTEHYANKMESIIEWVKGKLD